MEQEREEPTAGGELIARAAPGSADLLEDEEGKGGGMGAAPAVADIDLPTEGVLTLVCFTCGEEAYFAEADPPANISCAKCGGSVFRDFFTPTSGGEIAEDFEDSTARLLDADDAEGDATPGDIIDLNRD